MFSDLRCVMTKSQNKIRDIVKQKVVCLLLLKFAPIKLQKPKLSFVQLCLSLTLTRVEWCEYVNPLL
jgi:hypothetical protein